MTNAKVVVVVPVFNRPTTVCEALDSVLNQTRLPDQLVVIDDGSTDDTFAAVQRWLGERRPAFSAQLVKQSNRGVSAARNHGLALAGNCPFVAFLDSDDQWPQDFLARAHALLACEEQAVAATANLHVAATAKLRATTISAAQLARNPVLWMLAQGAGICSASLFRARAIRGLGGFREDLRTGEDAELFLRLSQVGSWRHVPGAPVLMGRHVAAKRGEADHLSACYVDNHRRWAEIFETFLNSPAGQGWRIFGPIRREVAGHWHRAGKELGRQGDFPAAQACFARALFWNPWSIKFYMRYGSAWLSAAHPSYHGHSQAVPCLPRASRYAS